MSSSIRAPEAGRSPRAVLAWLEDAAAGGVHLPARGGVRFVPWPQALREVRRAAAELAAAGLGPGDRVGVRGHNCYEWLVLDLALLSIGAVPVAFPVPDFAGRPNAELIAAYGLAAMFAGPESRAGEEGGPVAPLERLLDGVVVAPLAAPSAPAGPQVRVADRDVFTLAFSSGTAGKVKCLLLAWPGVAALVQAQSAAFPLRRGDRIMIALPLSTFQQRYLCYLAIRNDCDIELTTAARLIQALPLARPTIMLGPPAFFEFAETRYRNLPGRSRVRRDLLAALAIVLPAASLRLRWRRAVFRDFHRMFGGSMRLMLIGSAPVRPQMLRFFARAGFGMYQIYGMTEIGYIAWNRAGRNRPGSVGQEVYPGSVRLAADGEVLVRHDAHLCIGYEGEEPDEVAAVLRGPDLVATGDLGEWDRDGYLYLVGRKKNLLITKGGHKLQIESLEHEFCQAEGVCQAALLRDGDGLALAAFFDGDRGAARASVLGRIAQVNTRLEDELRIRRLALVEGPISADSPLLNRNLKINRAAVWDEVAGRLERLPAAPRASEE